VLRILLVCLTVASATLVVYLAASIAYRALRRKVTAYLEFRGTRVVVCPETREYVAVEVDALHAASSATEEEAELRLSSCTLWPERGDCDQHCVYQIANAPEDCAVRAILADFYEGQSCALCRKPFGELGWGAHMPALLRLYDRRTFGCRELPPETLPLALQSHLPVCWDCHVAESFRREFPHLVTDRDSKATAPRA
jgi:hypothetical protein